MRRLRIVLVAGLLLAFSQNSMAVFLESGDGDWFGNTWWDNAGGTYKTPDSNDDLWLWGNAVVTLNDLGAECNFLLVANRNTYGELYIGDPLQGDGGPGSLTITPASTTSHALNIGYNWNGVSDPDTTGLLSIAGASTLTANGHVFLGEYNNTAQEPENATGTLEVIGSEVTIDFAGNFVSGNNHGSDPNGTFSTTFNTLRFVPDAGGFSTINVEMQTYFWPGSIELDIAEGPAPAGDYVLISSGPAGSGFGTLITDMAFAPGVNTDRYSFEVIGDNLVLHVEPACQTKLPGDINDDCTVNLTDFWMLAKDWLVTVPSN